MKLGIIGLPNSGKTTIFNALTRGTRPTAPVSSGKIEIFTAVVNVPDERLDKLVAMYKPKKTAYTTITYTDIGGLEKGIGSGGINPQLRQELQSVDGYIHVVRAFEDDKFKQQAVVVDGHAPFLVVITPVKIVGGPGTARFFGFHTVANCLK